MRGMRSRGLGIAVAALGLLCGAVTPGAAPASGATHEDPLVRTGQGVVRGTADANGRQFRGIPYAAPPVGDLRWAPPRAHARWTGVRDATRFGHRCVQDKSWDPGYEQPTHTEDCLNLNVHTPARTPAERPRPVLVWLHGGGLTAGAGEDVVPDRFAAENGIVTVTVNYRLGALGFLGSRALGGQSGDFGMQDQQSALRWVRANIARFGGDPARVTVAGESAGGRSVCTQLAAPGSRGLFRSAIVQSGAYGDCAAHTREQADEQGAAFARRLGCAEPERGARENVADCLRRQSPARIIAAQRGMDWGPAAGTRFLPEQPARAIAAGRSARVPVMNGSNKDEGTLFAFQQYDGAGKPLRAADYPAALTSAFGERAGREALRRYPLRAYSTPTHAFAAALGDQMMSCPALRLNRSLVQGSSGTVRAGAPVYAYEFADRTSPPFESLRRLGTDFDFGATHVNEVPYLFDHFGHPAPLNAEQRLLARRMRQYWASFVRDGVPRAAGVPVMPEQHARPGTALSLRTAAYGGPATVRSLGADHRCDLWDSPGATIPEGNGV
ncbi:carboxylesterase family protein [Streptomyces sp. ODS28]|uniref:carboxylesterase/lipase family protein n=1 Tax=Streptomyces sp. ODS28 TaxID=3136688 RepID=UPI0031E7D107